MMKSNWRKRAAWAGATIAAGAMAIAPVQAQPAPKAQPAPAPAPAQSVPVPSMGFFSLAVADMARAEAFYTQGIGLKRAMNLTHPGSSIEEIGLNFSGSAGPDSGPILVLIHNNDPQKAATNASSGAKVGFIVADTHAVAARLRKLGYTVVREPAADEKGPVLNTVAKDPDGVTVEIVELRMPPRS